MKFFLRKNNFIKASTAAHTTLKGWSGKTKTFQFFNTPTVPAEGIWGGGLL
jgi:hypothetical protein